MLTPSTLSGVTTCLEKKEPLLQARRQCPAARGVGPFLSQMRWMRETGTCLVGMEVLTVSAAQWGVLSCQQTNCRGISTFTLPWRHCQAPLLATEECLLGGVRWAQDQGAVGLGVLC